MAVPAKRKSYSEEQIQLGLTALAYASGNSRRASRELKQVGLAIPQRTLHDWRQKTHPQKYEEIQAEVLPKIRERAAEKQMAVVEAATGVQHKLLGRLDRESGDMDLKDVSTASRNVAVVT